MANAIWYACEGKTKEAIASAVCALPAVGMFAGGLLEKTGKFKNAGKAVKHLSRMTQGAAGTVAGAQMAYTGLTNIINGIESGTLSAGDVAAFLGGIAVTALSGKNMVSSGRALQGVFDDVGKVSKTGKGDTELGQSGSTSVQHAVGSANQAQSVLDGINPKYFNPESRFGGGFYVGADADTIVAELAEHGNTAKYAISYDMNLSGQKVLDLTNPQIASEWGYVQNLTSTKACQNIAEIARNKGYNVIKFQSYRGDGINYVIFNNFENILLPRNVTPVE